jgi:hypothetical protein
MRGRTARGIVARIAIAVGLAVGGVILAASAANAGRPMGNVVDAGHPMGNIVEAGHIMGNVMGS